MTATPRRWALVTGASSGIGRALARVLAQRGIAVLVSGRNRERLALVQQQCRDLAPAVSRVADLASPSDRARLVSEAESVLQPPDQLTFLVHCAGVGDPSADFAAMQPRALEQAMAINVSAALDLTQRLLPRLIEAAPGRVMFVGAGIADHPQPGTGIYGISKQALARLFEQMKVDFAHSADQKLPALALFQPGLVDTAGLRDHIAKAECCHLPHAGWLQNRLDAGLALTAQQAAEALARALLDLDEDQYNGQTLHARTFKTR